MPQMPAASTARPSRSLFLLGLAAITGLIAFLTYSSVEKYLDARAAIVTQTAEDARLYREYADRTFQAVDISLEEVIRTVGTRPWSEIGESREVWHRMRKIADALPPLRSIWLVDQNGAMRLFSARWPTPTLDAIDREYFAAHGFGQPARLHFGGAMPGKYTGRVFVPVSRPVLVGPNGFRGVVAAAVEPGYYLPILEPDSSCAPCSVGIYRRDGTPLVTAGAAEQTASPEAIRGLFDSLIASGKRADTGSRDRFQGEGRSFVTATLSPTYDLGVVVAAPTSVVWSLWWERASAMLIVGVPCVLALVFLLHRARLASRLQEQARRDAEAAQQREKQLREQAARANRTKSEFLALMSHELRTPLNAVIGFSEIISKDSLGANHPNYRVYARDIYDSGQHLLSLINDILDLSKIEAKRHELHEESLELAGVFRAVQRLSEMRARQNGVTLEVADTDLVVIADARGLKQMLVNLVTNAIKFTDPGGTVSLKVDRDGAWLYLAVVDNGRGMTPAELERAVELFGQAETALTRRSEGTGLGLNICGALAELHGGGLDLVSAAGEGTRATIRLPIQRLVPAAPPQVPTPRPSVGSAAV